MACKEKASQGTAAIDVDTVLWSLDVEPSSMAAMEQLIAVFAKQG